MNLFAEKLLPADVSGEEFAEAYDFFTSRAEKVGP